MRAPLVIALGLILILLPFQNCGRFVPNSAPDAASDLDACPID